jgi:hypothetical protein
MGAERITPAAKAASRIPLSMLTRTCSTTAATRLLRSKSTISVDVDVNTGQVIDHIGNTAGDLVGTASDTISGLLNCCRPGNPLLGADIDGTRIVVGGDQSHKEGLRLPGPGDEAQGHQKVALEKTPGGEDHD